MRRADGSVRQIEAPKQDTCAKNAFMAGDKPLRFPSFWQVQIIGWLCFYISGLVGSIPKLLTRPAALRENAITVAMMFLGSCALRPVCRSLLRRSLPWLAFESRTAAWSILS